MVDFGVWREEDGMVVGISTVVWMGQGFSIRL